MEKTLQKLGLTKNEAKVYLSLLKLGRGSADRIAKDSKIHRRTVYDITDRLVQKGIVSYSFKQNKKYFIPSNPDELFSILQEKEEELKNILPQLNALYDQEKTKSKAVAYEGITGIKALMSKILKEDEWLAIGSNGRGKKVLSPFFVKNFMKKIKENNIKYRLLITRTKKAESEAKERKTEAPNVEYKFLPHYIQNPVLVWIFGDNVAFLPNPDDETPENRKAFLIKDAYNAESFKNYFHWLWRLAKK